MSAKNKVIAAIDTINAKYSKSPIIKGLIDGGLSYIPFLGAAVISALDTRSSQLFERNSKKFATEVKSLLEMIDEKKIDKEYLDSDEFASLLIEILTRNARTYEQEKIKLYAKLFVNATTKEKSAIPYKEGFVQIIDELSATHILIMAFIYEKCSYLTDADKKNNSDYVSAAQIAVDTGINISRVQAYGDQMIRFGLLRDWGIGRLDYNPGRYIMTDYGIEFSEFLQLKST